MLGERIKEVRTMRKKTQVQFARELGLSQAHISKIEKGVELPSETVLLFISQKYNINIDWLKNGNGTPEYSFGSGYRDYLNMFDDIYYNMKNKLGSMTTDQLWNSVDSFKYLSLIINNYFSDSQTEKSIEQLEKINLILSKLFIISNECTLSSKNNIINRKKCDELVSKINQDILDMIRF